MSGSSDCSIRTWNTTTWQQTAVLTRHTNTVTGIAISPDGCILASVSEDHTAQLWNLENGQPIGSPLQHADSVSCVSFSRDGRLLATGSLGNNAYSWDISKSVIATKATINDTDAIRPPDQQLEDANGLPTDFFNDSESPPRLHSPRRRRLLPSTAQLHHVTGDIHVHGRALLGRVSSLSRRIYNNIHHTLPGPRPLEWAGSPFSGMLSRRNDEHIELQECRPAVADVSCAHANFRYYSVRELLRKRQKDKEKAKAAKEKARDVRNASAGSLQLQQTHASGAAAQVSDLHVTGVSIPSITPAESSVTRQSGLVTPAQLTSALHVTGISTSSTTPAIAATPTSTTPTTPRPDVITIQDGRWTRFRLFICCMPARYPDD